MAQDPEYYRRYREANKERLAARAKAYYEANKEKKKEYARAYYATHKPEYRTRERANPKTPDQKRAARRRSGGAVAPPGELRVGRCENTSCAYEGRLDFDHDHATGASRGWLCPLCNRGLGMFSDSPEKLLGIVEYLKRHAHG